MGLLLPFHIPLDLNLSFGAKDESGHPIIDPCGLVDDPRMAIAPPDEVSKRGSLVEPMDDPDFPHPFGSPLDLLIQEDLGFGLGASMKIDGQPPIFIIVATGHGTSPTIFLQKQESPKGFLFR